MSEVRAADLPAFRAWSGRLVPPGDTAGYLAWEIPVLPAMVLLELVFPRLIEVRGCVVRADRYDKDNFDNWYDHFDGDVEQVERITNFLRVDDWFEPGDEIEEQALQTLADRIALGWRAQAARQFPERPLVAEAIRSTEDYGPVVVLYTGIGRRAPA